MSLSSDVLDALVASGASAEMIAAAVKAENAREELIRAERRARAAAKKRRQRARALSEEVSVSPVVPGDTAGHVGTNGDTPRSPPNAPGPPNTPPLSPQTQKEGARRATAFPEDFEPNRADLDCFAEQGVTTPEARAAVIAHWRDHHVAKGSVFKDWHASLRTWLRSPYRSQPPPVNGRTTSVYPHQRTLDVRKAQSVQDAARELARKAYEAERRGDLLAIGRG